MVHTVGVAGVNGNLGVPTVKALAKAAGEGKFKLVVFHREGSKPKHVEPGSNIEFRVLDFEDPVEKLEAAVKGLNVFISLVAIPAIPHESKIVDALAKLPDFVTYMPAVYSTTWEAEDFKDPVLSPILTFIHQAWDKAKAMGLGVTAVYCGAFHNFFFKEGFLGSPIKDNVVQANAKQLQKRIPITTLEHLGQAIANLATRDPHSIKDHDYSVVTFWPTGQELVDLYTKINGKPAEIKDFTDSDKDAERSGNAQFGPVVSGYKTKWENDGFTYKTGGKISIDDEYHGPGLEEVAREFA